MNFPQMPLVAIIVNIATVILWEIESAEFLYCVQYCSLIPMSTP